MEVNNFEGIKTVLVTVEIPEELRDVILLLYYTAMLKTVAEGHIYPSLKSFLGLLLINGYDNVDKLKNV